MGINFGFQQWNGIKENARKWWAGELKRPLIQITLTGIDPGRPEPKVPNHSFASFYDFSISAEEIVDRWDYDLSCKKFLGDAFPHIWPNFGAGVIAAFLGAKVENRSDTTWFYPKEAQDITEIRFVYDPENMWLKRIKDICHAAMERWGGLVQVGMTDLGGNLDILSSFRPGEKLLLDLYDQPDQVKRLSWEVHELWFQYFDEFNKILQPINPGYTAWTPIFSEEPYYMLQSDFCYMIAPEMFNEFVKLELAASCKRLINPFYHLDGPGQLSHLDSLLEIEQLRGIQWVPLHDVLPASQWLHVYRKIWEAGKLVQVFSDYDPAGFHILDILADHLGSAEGIVLIGEADISQEKEVNAFLVKYGVL